MPARQHRLIEKLDVRIRLGCTGGIKKLYPNKSLDKGKFTYQMSDHLPLWIQLDVDTDKEKLDQIIQR